MSRTGEVKQYDHIDDAYFYDRWIKEQEQIIIDENMSQETSEETFIKHMKEERKI